MAHKPTLDRGFYGTEEDDHGRYSVFIRSWWRPNPAWPNGLEPHAGRRKTIRRDLTLGEARRMCAEWNSENAPGRFSRKAEFGLQ